MPQQIVPPAARHLPPRDSVRRSRWLVGLLAAALLGPAAAWCDVSSDGALGLGLRLGYTHTEDNAGSDAESLSVGAQLEGRTAVWHHLSVGAALYATAPLGDLDDDELFLDSSGGPDGSGYAVVGQLWLQADLPFGSLRAGRQALETPFADSDDIGMIPNTFEAVVLESAPAQGLWVTAGHLRRWAGVDSSKERFDRINGDHGASFVGLSYPVLKGEVQGWYYYQKGGSDIAYVEAVTELHEKVQLALQWTHQRDRVADQQAMAWGAGLSWELGDFTLSGDFNKVFGTGSVINGYGGGPYFTSAEQNTIDGVSRIRALAAGVEYGGIDRLTLGARHAGFSKGVGDEWDFTASYALGEGLAVDLVHSDMGRDGSNTRAFLNYRLEMF